ncbi:ATP-binding protein [Coprococcus comes]|uniref:ATP-binding protein n=1 Tax=Coprococcus comes TaxID=410072 RepID=UPI00207A1486|nr:ATP-binding protein [Coprococcus comes]
MTTIDAFIKGASEKLDDPDATALQISNMVRDAIKPDITMFLHYETLEENGKKIVAVDIQRGTDRPYYIAKKGMRPEGVYARQGYLAVPATDAAIRQMIKETDGDRFEAMRSMNQELTFETTEKEFQLRKVEFGMQQMRTLKVIDQDGLYSNLAMLLSDQCVHTIKVAVFQGKDQTVFKDRREFAGALMKQMNDVYDYIDFHNQTHATIEKLLRIDVRDYPEIAVREALLNLLVHRDYAFSASALISIYEDRMEFVSIGGLMPGIDLEDVMAGISVCRNQDLANVFYRLHLIEAYGTGISKIIGAYADEEEKPVIETTRNAFKIILPNINAMREKVRISEPEAKEENPETNKEDTQELSSEEEQVLEYAGKHEDFTKNDVVSLLKVSASTAARVIRGLVERNFLKRNGKARNTYYTLQK